MSMPTMSLSPPQNSKNKRKHATGGRQQTTDRTSKHGKKTFGPFLEPPRQGTSQQPNPRTYVTPAHALSRAQLAVEPIACCENPWPNAWEVRSLVQRSSAGPRKSPQMERSAWNLRLFIILILPVPYMERLWWICLQQFTFTSQQRAQ